MVCQIMKNVMGLAAEVEIGVCYINARELLPIRTEATEMGHSQPPTSLQVDNSTTVGFTNSTINQNNQKPLTCVFIGSKMAKIRANSQYIGALVE